MKITKEIIDRLLDILNAGLCSGAGDMSVPGTFCVQQAVSMATGQPEEGDAPVNCINDEIRSWGINMNDQEWSSPKARSDGMRRFAVAQMGSLYVNSGRWETIFCTNWNSKHPECAPIDEAINVFPYCGGNDVLLTDACNIAAMALQVLESEGSEFLYLTEPHVSQEHKDFMNRLYKPLPQLTWRGQHASQTHHQGNPISH
jgi:hypothetical protein